jgi:hypothetical protein
MHAANDLIRGIVICSAVMVPLWIAAGWFVFG